MQSAFRSLPSVEQLLQRPELELLLEVHAREAITDLVRAELAAQREAIRGGADSVTPESVATAVVRRAKRLLAPWPIPVVNATGVIIHTNLGRAPLSAAAMTAIHTVGAAYSDLEIDLESGTRGSRYAHISDLLGATTGAESGLVVNNNASAVLLVLTALCAGREVVVSRGEAVEIGGGFRIPDVLAQSGAQLVEVGTTNRTYTRDFERAVTERTAAFLRIHSSNFRVTGFTHTPELHELAAIARESGVLLLNDLGSGCLLDVTRYGLAREPLVGESVTAGADLSMFSGDKLLGGPQAGIIVGRRGLVDRIRSHPLTRALRVEKTTLAALSATLLSYAEGKAEQEIPVWRMIAMPETTIRERAERWLRSLAHPERASLVRERSAIGGGSLPGETLPTTALAISRPTDATAFLARLRAADTPVIARIDADRVLLDPRTVLENQDDAVITALNATMDR